MEKKPLSYTARLRTLTKKSKLGATKAYDRKVDYLLSTRTGKDTLIWCYYSLEGITFMDDILDELKIEPEHRISKPGINEEYLAIYKIETEIRFGTIYLSRDMGSPVPNRISKASLQGKNHGRK